MPFKWYPKEEILPHAAAWRLLDLSESNGRPIDLVIASKFPTYFVRHPNKVAWLIHQYRAAYELCGTPYSDFSHTESDVGLRDRLIRLDTEMLGECRRDLHQRAEHRRPAGEVQRPRRRAAVSSAAARAAGSTAGPLRRLRAVGRPDRVGQARGSDRVARWLSVDRPLRLVVAGDGTQRANVERVAADARRRRSRRRSSARSTTSTLLELYAGALGGRVSAVRRGLRLRDARSVPRAQAGRHLRRLRRTERVRRRRRQRLRLRAGARGARGGDQPLAARSRGARRLWATPATTVRARSPGTA